MLMMLFSTFFSKIGLMEDCIARLNEDLSHILSWSNGNNMKLNPAKSVAMLCSKDEINFLDFPTVEIDNEVITYVKDIKYLGYRINKNLTCCSAISDTIRNIYFGLRSLRSSSDLLLPKMKIRLIKSLIMPYFTFNCSVYPILDCECRRRLNVALNDCIRFIYNVPRYSSVSHLRHTVLGLNLDEYLKFRLVGIKYCGQ